MGIENRPAARLLRQILLLATAIALAACTVPPTTTAPTAPIPQEIPPLPFADNPDPALCGIPQPDGRTGVVAGWTGGSEAATARDEIIYLYDGHARQAITGQVFAGTPVNIVLRQSNPALDYYYVETRNVTPAQKGWAPAPFVQVD